MRNTLKNAVCGAAAPFLLLAACSSPAPPLAERPAPSPAAAAETTVMVRHDSLMAKMDTLYLLKTKITKVPAPAAGPYLRGLAAADAAMMGWMHHYRAPDSTVAAPARLAYFQEQQRVLGQVSQQFRATIDSASLFISRLPEAKVLPSH